MCSRRQRPLFEPDTAYSKFGALALLKHDGVSTDTARALAAEGYGEHTRAVVASHQDKDRPSSLLAIEDLSALIAAVDSAPAPRYVVRGVLPEGDYGMLGAEDKAGKTWATADLATSVASGTPWLGIYPVESPGSVLLFAGEGGGRKVVRRFRAVCESRGIDPAGLSIRVCLRVPHLTSDAAMLLVEEEVAERRPRLVIIDPLYLAARGAKGSDLYEMGAHLEHVQAVCQRYGAALIITHHFKKTGDERGAKRMSGVGPGAWGRVLITATVRSRHTDPTTSASSVVLELEFMGDEIAESTRRIRRRVWADDPDNLTSPLHYEVTAVESIDQDPTCDGLRPSSVRVLKVLDAVEDWLTVRAIGDVLAENGSPLKARTIQGALGQLVEADLAVAQEILGGAAGKWRSARAQSDDSEGENAF